MDSSCVLCSPSLAFLSISLTFLKLSHSALFRSLSWLSCFSVEVTTSILDMFRGLRIDLGFIQSYRVLQLRSTTTLSENKQIFSTLSRTAAFFSERSTRVSTEEDDSPITSELEFYTRAVTSRVTIKFKRSLTRKPC